MTHSATVVDSERTTNRADVMQSSSNKGSLSKQASINGAPARDLRSWAIMLIRVLVGVIFLAHGSQKLFAFGFHGVEGFFAKLGIPLPGITAPLVILLEFVGGIALLVGFQTRWVALLLALDMLGAILFVHLKGGFFLPAGSEFALTLLISGVALALAGPGSLAVDGLLAGRRK